MSRFDTPIPPRHGRRLPKEKPAKRGTPVRNSLLLLIFAVILVAAVIILPNEPTYQPAVVVPPGENAAEGPRAPMDLPLRITEVMSTNKFAYPDESGLYSDWVEIQNTGAEPVNIKGIGLSDREDRVRFTFPDMDLAPGAYLVIFCDGTNKSEKNAAFHARFKISASGETVYLFDPFGIMLDSVEVPPLHTDTSYAQTPGGWNSTEKFTPGFPNDTAGHEAFRASTSASADGLVLNEICASNRTTLADEDGEYSDWIELYNGGRAAVDLSNFVLSNRENKPVKWRFPQGAVIGPGEHYLVFASGKNRSGGDGTTPHTNFRLAAEGETVILSDILGRTVDRVVFDNLGKDESYGRVPGMDNTWQLYRQPTPGLPNLPSSEIEMDRRLRAANNRGVFISEVASASVGMATPYGLSSYDWIELYNATKEIVELTGWGLSDNIGHPRKWQFPEGVFISPGAYLLVFASGLAGYPPDEALHTSFRLSALGETVVLADPQGKILDKLVVPRLEVNNSYGRDFDRGGLFYYERATAGKANNTKGYLGYAPKPSIDQKGGMITRQAIVTISAPDGVRVRYTLDGSEPTETVGTTYTGPITIPDSTVVRARGFQEGYKGSEIVTETFLFNAYHILPIIALTVDPFDLWDPLTGIYADGDEDTFEEHPFQKATYYQINKTRAMRERAGHFEFFSPEGEPILNQGIAIQLHGNYSLDLPQKSFRITAKPKYGSVSLAYPFFKDRPFEEYRALILRNGGVEGSYSRIVDALCAKLVNNTGSSLLSMASTPVIVYLNGEYWGQYEIRERINKYYVAMSEGWPEPRGMDFIKANNTVLCGTFDDYRALFRFVRDHHYDLSDPAAFERVANWIDLENYFDFMIFQTYFANTDTLNIKFYRQRVPGAKWRWIFFDLDWGLFMRKDNGFRIWLKEGGSGPKNGDNWLIRSLLKSPQGKDMFLRRYGELWKTLADTDQTIALIDEMVAEMKPEMSLHFGRWAGLTSIVVAQDNYLARNNAEKFWMDRVNRLKNVVRGKPYHVWNYAKEWFSLTDEEMLDYFGPCPEETEDIY